MTGEGGRRREEGNERQREEEGVIQVYQMPDKPGIGIHSCTINGEQDKHH